MVIRRLEIRNFGKIHDAELEFKDGINVLYGENESGKTTVHTFIRSMFYGLPRSRGRAAKKNSYAKYEPWENPADFGGSLWLEKDQKEYRIRRSFAKEYAEEEFFCETDQEPLSIEDGDLEELLGGTSETVYDNTVSVAQLKSVTGKDLVSEVQNYMISYQGTGDTSVDLGRAIQMLKMTRKGYAVQKERLNRNHEAERNKIISNYSYLEKELSETSEKKSALQQKNSAGRESSRTERVILEKRRKNLNHMKKMMMVGMVFTFLIPILLSILLFIAFSAHPSYGMVTLLLGAAGLFLECLALRKLNVQEKELKKSSRQLKKQEDKRNWEEERLAEQMSEKQTALMNLQMELDEVDYKNQEMTQAQIEVDALTLAMETMENLTREYRSNVGLKLRKRTSEILSEITDGKYNKVLIDFDFHIQVSTEERIVSLDSLSRGTMEQIYFALRMAAGELLCGGQTFPIILDDVFGMYDEERLAGVLHWLEKEKRQIIISTCHKREMEILEKEGISFHKILLNLEERS